MSLLDTRLLNTGETDAERFAQRRRAIDLIATTRARAIRVALFGSYLFRKNPLGDESEYAKEQWKSALLEQYQGLQRSASLVQGHDPRGQVPDWICDWLRQHAEDFPEQALGFATIRDLTQDVVQAVELKDDHKLHHALQAHLKFGRGSFFDLATAFCDGLWETLDASRHKEVVQAASAGQTISDTLERLEKIGKHVRLVSFNASVEAARAGDAGRGLGVIAVEFKTLAEEIQRLSTTARSEITAMIGDVEEPKKNRFITNNVPKHSPDVI